VSKLTLSVDDAVVRRAKRYARRWGTSVSRLVERFLDLVARGRGPAARGESGEPPVLRRLRGALRTVHLGRKSRITTIHCLARRARGPRFARQTVGDLSPGGARGWGPGAGGAGSVRSWIRARRRRGWRPT